MMIRTAALPVAALAELRFEKSWATVVRSVELDSWLRGEGVAIADELHGLIGTEPGPLRGDMVALRRAVFAQRLPSSRAWSDAVRASLPVVLQGRILSWIGGRQERSELVADLPALVAADDRDVTERLLHRLRTPAFRHGLVLSSPVLAQQLERWFAGVVPQRQTIRRLVKYLARVAAKTSPYSTFTISGLVPASDIQGSGLLETVAGPSWGSTVELDARLIRRMLTAIATRPTIREGLQVRRNPSLIIGTERHRFLAADDSAALVGLRRGAALDACLDRASDPAGCTVGQLHDHLLQIDPALEPAAVEEFVGRLLQAGPICVELPFADQVDDHLTAAAAWADPDSADLAAGLRALAADLAAYPAIAEPVDRAATRDRIGVRAEQLLRGSQAIDEVVPRKHVFHENAVFTAQPAVYGRDAWQPIVAQLAEVRGILAALDSGVPTRAAFTDVFVERFGSGAAVPWLDVYQESNRAMAEGAAGMTGAELSGLWAGPNFADPQVWWALPYARDLAKRVDRATGLIFAAARGGGSAQVRAAQLTEALGCPPGPPDSVACYGQLVGPDGRDGFVLNNVISGYGRGLNKVDRMLRQVGADDVADWEVVEYGPYGELLVESDNLFGSSLNLRTRSTRFELDYPSTTSARPPSERIPMSELVVAHDRDSGTLRLVRHSTGERIRPMHGGLKATFWLPEPLQHLLSLFGPTHTLLYGSTPLFVPRGNGVLGDVFGNVFGDVLGGGIRQSPRIRIGDVVLSRRSWVVPARLWPQRRRGEGDEAFWVRVAAWHADNGLPDRYFVRGAMASGQARRADHKTRKPTFVDLAAPHLVALLERLFADAAELVIITEALPDLDAAVRYGSDRHVTELVVELPGGSS